MTVQHCFSVLPCLRPLWEKRCSFGWWDEKRSWHWVPEYHSQLSESGNVQQDQSQQWDAALKYSRYLLGNDTDRGQNIPKWHSLNLDWSYKLFSTVTTQVTEKHFTQVTTISGNFQVWLMNWDARCRFGFTNYLLANEESLLACLGLMHTVIAQIFRSTGSFK